ncbi:MAG TPA: SHOCT domain-containing protein [Vicinamibacterales bacterium]
MRRRGLVRSGLRTAGRTALIAGTASAVSGGVARRQREAFDRQHQAVQPPVPETNAESPDLVSRLHQLADLKAMGALTEKEFAAAKSKLLND